MTTSSDEQLSALLDGELQGREERQAVDRICDADPDTRARLGRFRLIGDLMRGESQLLGPGIHESVRTAIADEPTVLAPRPPKSRWARPIAGVAVAASVAAAAIVIAPQFLGQPLGFTEGATVASTGAGVAAPAVPQIQFASEPTGPVAAVPAPRWQTLDPALSERLNRLVIEHHEFGGRTGVNGPVAHIGLVNYAGR